MIALEMIGLTDVGLRRAHNEDAFIVLPEQRVLAVADGMGGAAAGEVASSIFVAAVRECFTASAATAEDAVYRLVQQVFTVANERIIEHVALNPDADGMGSTADLLTFTEGRYIIGHVGDSRIYLLRNGELRQLTKDHSLVQMHLDKGIITAEEARVHPKKNIVLRAVGIERDFSLDILRGNVFTGDLFLLCSDGLTNMVEDSALARILSSSSQLSKKASILIESAKEGGGRDNITVVLCQVKLE